MRIALIGDSHSQLIFPPLSRGLEELGHQVVLSVSKPGWSEKSFIADTPTWSALTDAAPDRVIVSLGGNNQTVDEGSYQAQLEELLGRIAGAGATSVLWIGPFDVDSARAASTARRHESTRELQAVLLPQLGVTWIDGYPLSDLSGSRDGVHMTASAYMRLAPAVLSDVRGWLTLGVRTTTALWWAAGAAVVLLSGAVWWRYRRGRP